jgi:glycerol-3-phosphate acyltransferase PlsY
MLPSLLAAAYALGGVSPGWCLVKWKAGIDIRDQGSGVTGATNAARALGARTYGLVLVLDALKGFAAVFGVRALARGDPWAALAAPMVVAGHIWPVWLRFRGGRGAAPLLGVCFALHWAIAPLAWVPGLVAGVVFRKAFAARALAFLASLPAALWLLAETAPRVSFLLAWALVLLAHRNHFAKKTAPA